MAIRYALVTGCSAGGIGSALCAELARRGIHVFATARSTSKIPVDLTIQDSVTALALDVTSPASLSAAVEAVRERTGGRLDFLVNNAGGGFTAPLLDTDLDAAKRIYDVNVWGMLATTQAFAPLLIEAHGTVLNIGSITAVASSPWLGASFIPFPRLQVL